VCPTEDTRRVFNADFTIWLDTIKEGRYENTNKLFEEPNYVQLTIDTWNYDVNQLVKLIRQYESR
jgi:adenylylsulfate kinase